MKSHTRLGLRIDFFRINNIFCLKIFISNNLIFYKKIQILNFIFTEIILQRVILAQIQVKEMLTTSYKLKVIQIVFFMGYWKKENWPWNWIKWMAFWYVMILKKGRVVAQTVIRYWSSFPQGKLFFHPIFLFMRGQIYLKWINLD